MNPENAILSLVSKRGPSKSICPSEAARLLAPEDWRNKMDEVRNSAKKLVNDGKIVVTQKGKIVDPEKAVGPVRYRLIGDHPTN
ncbi:MAG: DUF3253 domain-containing protein [Planctomycetota bacterium]